MDALTGWQGDSRWKKKHTPSLSRLQEYRLHFNNKQGKVWKLYTTHNKKEWNCVVKIFQGMYM